MIEAREDYIIDLFKKENINLDKRQACQFLNYYNLLTEWNEKVNLTAITEFKEVCIKHFLDSASIYRLFSSFDSAVSFFSDKTIADIGTGAGFPGICLKILFPGLKVTLIDSLDKRVKFLNEVIGRLGLADIRAIHGRVEDLAKDKSYREQFDFATARAVASLPVLSEYCLPFVKLGGYFISYKSERANDELSISENALNILGGKFERSSVFSLSDEDYSRTLLLISKVAACPTAYPRKAGTPSKKPL